MRIRVYYEDTDIGGIVYHSKYLNFCERSRSEIFFSHDVTLHSDDGFFVVKHIDASFIKPAFFQDILEVKTYVKKIGISSVDIHQVICRDEADLFSMKVQLVYVKSKRPKRIPSNIVDFLMTMKG